MRRLLLLLPLVVGCHLDDLLRSHPEVAPPKCYANLYIYKVDPITKQRFDSSWAGQMEVPCPKGR